MLKKIISISEASVLLKKLKANNAKIFLAHGVFDILHLGHIKHFEDIKKKDSSAKLFVTITGDNYVKRGPGRPYFKENQRAEMLSSISFVDYVIIIQEETAQTSINLIKPNIYFKGKDYLNLKDFTGNLKKELDLVKGYKGKVVFTETKKFSSSNIINTQFDLLKEEAKTFLSTFSKKNNFDKINNILEKFKNLKVLVLGEGIIDEYIYTKPLNKTPKENLISYLRNEKSSFLGGVFAVSNNISSFCNDVTLLTLAENNSKDSFFIKKNLKKKLNINLISSNKFKNIKKIRFIENSYFPKKIFELYEMKEDYICKRDEKKILSYLNKNLKKFDIVILNDFGHGFFTNKIIDILIVKSKYLAINVQTNSGNLPFNLVTKYNKADYICIDKPEALLAVGKKNISKEEIRNDLFKKIKFKNICITDGKNGAWYFKNKFFKNVPVFNYNVVDTMGSGDAFFAISSLASKLSDDAELITFLGNVAGSMKVSIIGHSKNIDYIDYAKYVESLLK
ncbi:K21344 rfaE1; D-glycero-beta-D-manno-heptose-7-phosphate kinase [Candidatus Pelagibacterales bacterium]